MKLYYSKASPFARIVRIVAAERDLALDLVEEDSFPPEEVLEHSPTMQVPHLLCEDGSLFGTRLITSYLLSQRAGENASCDFAMSETRPDHHWQDAQLLTGLETLLNSLVSRSYLIWTGAKFDQKAQISIDLTDRELVRAMRLLDWIENTVGPAGSVPGLLSLQDVWLISTLAWTDVRIRIPWRERPNIEAIVARHSQRPSILDTAPPTSMVGQITCE